VRTGRARMPAAGRRGAAAAAPRVDRRSASSRGSTTSRPSSCCGVALAAEGGLDRRVRALRRHLDRALWTHSGLGSHHTGHEPQAQGEAAAAGGIHGAA
jgi:hypothetical protein